MGDREVELEAIKCVMEYEKSRGRNPINISKTGVGYDIRSGNLKIEVKGLGKDKKPHVLLSQHNIEFLEDSGESDYRLYVVMNPVNNPKIIVFTKNDVVRKKIELRQWKIPLRKAEFEKGIFLK